MFSFTRSFRTFCTELEFESSHGCKKDFGREQVSGATMEIPKSSLSPHGDVILDKLHVLQPTSEAVS